MSKILILAEILLSFCGQVGERNWRMTFLFLHMNAGKFLWAQLARSPSERCHKSGSHLISQGSYWEENIRECLKSPRMGKHRAQTIHTEWSACQFYTDMTHPGLSDHAQEVAQEGSQAQLLLWCCSMQAIHVKNYETPLIHSAALMDWHLPVL